ncbi:hypothetical protein [Acinetobacter sp. YH12021]|uniref:hypothetical protein n=1 Tax=Acinetobacter sp. YH12021 TaxID=2601040 RepID=UPI0015D0D591|nr:hypothetical protein [Acinetobacter sp. YH12021]
MQQSLDNLSSVQVDINNNHQNWLLFNEQQGMRQSLNENLVPERFFNDPNSTQKNVDGISAAKAIKLAAEQGQKIYQIDRNNINTILPNLNHDSQVIADIRNAVAAGKVVTTTEKSINFYGWQGSGYIILDPNTGSGAYMISGGLNGGFAYFMGVMVAALLLTAIIALFATNPLGAVMGAAMIAGLEALIATVLWGILAYLTVNDSKCFIAGFKSAISVATFGLGKKLVERIMAGLVGITLAHTLYDDAKTCIAN